jgi:hypothetical protein
VIVAHTENHYDGSGVKRLLANKFELDKVHQAKLFFFSFLKLKSCDFIRFSCCWGMPMPM